MRFSPKIIIKNLSCYKPIKITKISREIYALTKTFCLNRCLFPFVCLKIFQDFCKYFNFGLRARKLMTLRFFFILKEAFPVTSSIFVLEDQNWKTGLCVGLFPHDDCRYFDFGLRYFVIRFRYSLSAD